MTSLDEIAQAQLEIWNKRLLESDRRIDVSMLTLHEAYAIQQKVINERIAKGQQIIGYKVGCTSNAIRKQFGLSEPICGRLMAPNVHHGETDLNWHDYVQCAVEPEFVISIGKDLTKEIKEENELIDAIEWVAPGIEVHNFKFWFGKPTSQELIVSNGIHAALVVGEERTSPRSFDFAMEGVGLFRNDELAASGIGAEIMGGPLISLRWLVHHLLIHGECLKAGQLVAPGSAVELVSVKPGDRITARFTHIGGVSAAFSA